LLSSRGLIRAFGNLPSPKSRAACWTLNFVRTDAPDFGGLNLTAAFRASRVQGCHDFIDMNLSGTWHAENCIPWSKTSPKIRQAPTVNRSLRAGVASTYFSERSVAHEMLQRQRLFCRGEKCAQWPNENASKCQSECSDKACWPSILLAGFCCCLKR